MTYSIITLQPTTTTVHGFSGALETRTEYPRQPDNCIYREGAICLCEDINGLPADDPTILPYITKVRERICGYLWAAADAYEKDYISGVAIGLLTIGVLQQKPIALAISQWSGNHWTEYYTRKAAIMAGAEPNYDFSSSGDMPYSVPELRAELGL